jgi:hypothetical protein
VKEFAKTKILSYNCAELSNLAKILARKAGKNAVTLCSLLATNHSVVRHAVNLQYNNQLVLQPILQQFGKSRTANQPNGN